MMNNKNRKSILLIGAVACLALFCWLYFFSSPNVEEKITPVPQKKIISDEYSNYIKGKAEEIVVGEYGIAVTAEISIPNKDKQQDTNGIWTLTVPLNSLNSDIYLLDGKGETPWMDHVRFDRELTEFERLEKENLSQKKESWQKIIDDQSASAQVIKQIQTVYIPRLEESELSFQKRNSFAKNLNSMFEERFGIGIENIPEKYKGLYSYSKNLYFITESIISLLHFNLQVKRVTINEIQNKNTDMVVTAANDEDRISLALSWHEERFIAILKLYEEMKLYAESLK